METRYRTIFGFWALAFVLITSAVKSQTAGGANGMVFRFTKQVWLNPTIILAKQSFEQSTNVKLLILPRVNGDDTTGSSRIEKAFDKLLSFLVYKDNVQGSIKFYFNPKNPTKPFTFNLSDELFCKFTPLQKDSVETIMNKDIVNSSSLNNFTALPFDSIINRASRYCKKVLQSKPGPCGENPGNEFTLTKINSTPAKLNFAKGINPNPVAPNGGVDTKKYAELEQYYNTVLDVADNSNYPLAWKAMAANTSDVIKLKLKKKQSYFDLSKLVFKNANGTETYNVNYNNIGQDSIIELSMSGKSPGSMAEVVAFYTPTTTPTQTFAIGAFNVQFYEQKTLNVVLVNLGGATLPATNAVKDSLNRIYGSAFIKWNVTAVTYSLPPGISKNIHVESSGLLSNYMPDMQSIVSSFKDNCPSYDGSSDNTYYLLFGCTNDSDPLNKLTGYMPRARNTGFIFDTDIRTIAHELGHGAFNLKHIFSSDELGEGYKKQTDNLMDYVEDSKLYKYQWDLIHNPASVSWFGGDDDDGASVTISNIAAFAALKNTSNDTYTFISPAGKYITLPPDVKSVRFSTFDRLFSILNNTANLNAPSDDVVPFGALLGFTDKDGKAYSTRIEGGMFKGYRQTGTTEVYYKDKYTAALNPSSGISTFVGFKNNGYVFYASTFPSINTSPANLDSLSSGALLKEFSVVGFTPADLTITLQAALTQKKTNNQLLELTEGTFSLTNEGIMLSYLGQNKTVGQFLIDVLKDTSKVKDYLAYFTLVNMKQNEFQGFANCLNQASQLDYQMLRTSLRIASGKASYGGSGRLYEAADIYNSIRLKTLEELVAAAQGNLAIVNLLKNGVASAKTAQELHDIIAQNFTRCSMVGIDIDTRLAVLRKFLGTNYNNDHWYTNPGMFYIDDGGFILDGLITTTPAYDRIRLLKEGFMADNYLWLRNMWSDANTAANGVSYEDVTGVLQQISVWVKTHFEALQVPITTKTEMVGDISYFQSYQFPVGMREFYIGMSSGHTVDFQTGYELYPGYEPAEVTFESSGQVHFAQDYIFSENYLVVSAAGSPSPYKTYHAYHDETLNAFEPVKVIVAKHYGGLGFTAGDEFTIPAYMAMIYQRNIEREVSDQRLRLIGDGIMIAAAVLTAPVSGGGSLATLTTFVTTVGGITSALDIAIQNEKNSLSPEQQQQNAGFYAAWDQFKLTVDVANLGVGLVNAAPRVYNFARNFNAVRTWNNVNTICKTNLSNLSLKAKNAWNSIKGITVLSEDILLVSINRLNLTALRNKINLLTNVNKAKFCDDFILASDEALITLNNNPGLVDVWQSTGTIAYPNVSNIPWNGTTQSITSGLDIANKKVLLAIEDQFVIQPLSGSRPVMAGAYCEELGGDVIVRYNLTTAEKAAFNYNALDPVIKEHIAYLNMIRNDMQKGGKLYQKLYTGVTEEKLLAAGDAASHAEVLAMDEVIKAMRQNGLFNSRADLSKIRVLVKGKSDWGNMCRCPHCFQLTKGVRMIGNE